MSEIPTPPRGLRKRARDFWSFVLEKYELERDELELFREVVRTLNELDLLEESVRENGAMVRGSRNNLVVNPAIAALNSGRALFGKLLAQLALPHDDGTSLDTSRTASARNAGRARAATEAHRVNAPLDIRRVQ